jgi:hypothetical protein
MMPANSDLHVLFILVNFTAKENGVDSDSQTS